MFFEKLRKRGNCVKIVFARLNHHCEVSNPTDKRPALQCFQFCVGFLWPFSPPVFTYCSFAGKTRTPKRCLMAMLSL